MADQEVPEWMRKLLENGQIMAGRSVNISTGKQVIVNIEQGGKDKPKQGDDGEDTNIATHTVKR
jgi:hypothetical protein